MSVGDNTDMFGRLKNLLPAGWFGDNNPIRDALLWGYANALAWGYTLYLYAKAQTRIKSATDGWLDLIGLDFFGKNLIRYSNQSDASYKNRILINIFRERTTRHAMEQVLYDLTGRWPIIIEPARPADVGSYGAAVAVSRASTATYFDLNGRLATADVNVARYDTDPVTGLGRLLVEAAATNSLSYSSDFTNAAWSKTSATPTASAAVAPDGSTMQKLVEGAAASTHRVSRSSLTAGTPWTVSVFAKAGERTVLTIGGTNIAANGGGIALFDLVAGVVTANPIIGSVTTMTACPNGVWRCTVTFPNTLSSQSLTIGSAIGSTVSYTGDGASGLYIWGAQQESGLIPTSYIPTTSATVTRAADTLLNNMPAGSIAIGGYGAAGAYGSVLLPYQAFITAFRPNGQGLPFISGYGISTGAYSTPSRSAYGQLSGGDVTDGDIYAAIDATKPIGTVAWTRISS